MEGQFSATEDWQLRFRSAVSAQSARVVSVLFWGFGGVGGAADPFGFSVRRAGFWTLTLYACNSVRQPGSQFDESKIFVHVLFDQYITSSKSLYQSLFFLSSIAFVCAFRQTLFV